MNRARSWWGLGVVVAAVLFLYSLLPIGTALQFSPDEGYEVMKPFLYNQGHVLYREIWDDQPPVFTILIANAFKSFGTTILTARLVTACFGVLLIAVFHELIRGRSGQWCALLVTFFLLSSPGVLQLSVSVMQEVPALAAGLLAAWLLFQWAKRRHLAWLLGSGVVMGVALQIKFTAILLAPAMIIELALLSGAEQDKPSRPSQLARNIVLWSASVVAIALLIGFTWGKGSFESSWKSHTGEQYVPGLERVEDHTFEPQLLENHVECVLAAAGGIGLALQRKRGREIAFPVAMLLTDSLVHAVHRPWWNYYYLHLAIPLTWLAGWGVNQLIQDILRLHAKYRFKLSSAAWKQWGLCLLVALAVTRSELRLEGMVKKLRQHPAANLDPIIKKMKEYAGHTHLVYSELGLYAFHAQLPMPPELAVVTPKRFWSGQITTGEIIAACQRNRVEQLLLNSDKINHEWKDMLENYAVVYQDKDLTLYFSRGIEQK